MEADIENGVEPVTTRPPPGRRGSRTCAVLMIVSSAIAIFSSRWIFASPPLILEVLRQRVRIIHACTPEDPTWCRFELHLLLSRIFGGVAGALVVAALARRVDAKVLAVGGGMLQAGAALAFGLAARYHVHVVYRFVALQIASEALSGVFSGVALSSLLGFLSFLYPNELLGVIFVYWVSLDSTKWLDFTMPWTISWISQGNLEPLGVFAGLLIASSVAFGLFAVLVQRFRKQRSMRPVTGINDEQRPPAEFTLTSFLKTPSIWIPLLTCIPYLTAHQALIAHMMPKLLDRAQIIIGAYSRLAVPLAALMCWSLPFASMASVASGVVLSVSAILLLCDHFGSGLDVPLSASVVLVVVAGQMTVMSSFVRALSAANRHFGVNVAAMVILSGLYYSSMFVANYSLTEAPLSLWLSLCLVALATDTSYFIYRIRETWAKAASASKSATADNVMSNTTPHLMVKLLIPLNITIISVLFVVAAT